VHKASGHNSRSSRDGSGIVDDPHGMLLWTRTRMCITTGCAVAKMLVCVYVCVVIMRLSCTPTPVLMEPRCCSLEWCVYFGGAHGLVSRK
jgi:hypothetical protein